MTDPTMTDVKVPGTDWMDDYDTGSSFVPPPQAKSVTDKGKTKFNEFLVQAPNASAIKFRDANGAWLKTKDGFLKAVVEGLKLVESGYEIGQTHIGTGQYKKWDRKTNQPIEGEFRNASPALDYLRTFGVPLKPATPEEYEQYFVATADRQGKITIDWSAYDKDSQSDVAGKWDEFPNADSDEVYGEGDRASSAREIFGRLYPGADPKGQKLPFIEKNGKRFWARAQVKRWISAVE